MRILEQLAPNTIRLSWDEQDGSNDIYRHIVGMRSVNDIVERMREHFGTFMVDDCAMLHRSETSTNFQSGVDTISFTVNGIAVGKYYTICAFVEGGMGWVTV